MAEPTTASKEPDNNNCPKHDHYEFTCGTCTGHFDKNGNRKQKPVCKAYLCHSPALHETSYCIIHGPAPSSTDTLESELKRWNETDKLAKQLNDKDIKTLGQASTELTEKNFGTPSTDRPIEHEHILRAHHATQVEYCIACRQPCTKGKDCELHDGHASAPQEGVLEGELEKELDKLLNQSPTDQEVPASVWGDLHGTWTGLWTDSYGEWDEQQASDLWPIRDLLSSEREEWLKSNIVALFNKALLAKLEELKEEGYNKAHTEYDYHPTIVALDGMIERLKELK